MTHCQQCPALRACRYSLGKFYPVKSSGGQGCHHPFTAEQYTAINAALDAEPPEPVRAPAPPPDLFIEHADNETQFAPRPWIVQHLRIEYETTAKTEVAAINNIRFKLYGTRPRRSLPPFYARPKSIGNISRADALSRLSRLAQ